MSIRRGSSDTHFGRQRGGMRDLLIRKQEPETQNLFRLFELTNSESVSIETCFEGRIAEETIDSRSK